MEIHLLRDLLNNALKEPDEETRVGCFWVHAPDYDECIFLFKIFLNQQMKWFACDEYKITRTNNDFLIEDSYGNKDTITNDEMLFLIDLWEKTLKVKPNIIELYLNE